MKQLRPALWITAFIILSTLNAHAETWFPVRDRDRCAYMNEAGKVVLTLAPGLCGTLFRGALTVGNRWDKSVIINRSGNVVYETSAILIPNQIFKPEQMVAMCEKDEWTFLDMRTNKPVPFSFKRSCAAYRGWSFSEGLAAVPLEQGGKGFIDETGAVAIRSNFSDARNFSEGLAAVMVGEKWGYIDKTGAIKIAPKYEAAEPFSEGLALVFVGDKTGFIDSDGALRIKPQWSSALSFSEGLAKVYRGEKAGFIDKTGKIIIPLKFDRAQSFLEGRASVSLGRKAGFIDRTGRIVVAAQYDYFSIFQDGLAAVAIGNKRGWINKAGEYIRPLTTITDSNLQAFVGDWEGTCTKGSETIYISTKSELILDRQWLQTTYLAWKDRQMTVPLMEQMTLAYKLDDGGYALAGFCSNGQTYSGKGKLVDGEWRWDAQNDSADKGTITEILKGDTLTQRIFAVDAKQSSNSSVCKMRRRRQVEKQANP